MPRGIRYALVGAALFLVVVVAIRKLREPEPARIPDVPASAYVRHGEGELDDDRSARVVSPPTSPASVDLEAGHPAAREEAIVATPPPSAAEAAAPPMLRVPSRILDAPRRRLPAQAPSSM